jgi:hypothetical protein
MLDQSIDLPVSFTFCYTEAIVVYSARNDQLTALGLNQTLFGVVLCELICVVFASCSIGGVASSCITIIASQFAKPHCIALNCIALHRAASCCFSSGRIASCCIVLTTCRIALYCTASHCHALHRTASHRIASHCIALNRIASHRIASHRIALHRIASHCIALHRIASH